MWLSRRRVLAGDAADEPDGSVVSYLQLAHNERHPVSGNPVAKVIHNFGRADKVDRAGWPGWCRRSRGS